MLQMFEGLLKPSTLIAIVAAIAIALYLYFLDKRTKSVEAAALCKKYAKMTEDLLAATPDEEVVRAVVANLQYWGVPEPEAAHIQLVESLIASSNPSAKQRAE